MDPLPISVASNERASTRSAWLFSWPLIVGAFVYLFSLSQAEKLLKDGDTYWHIAAGQWILKQGTVPTHDPFSHTMRGAPWTAHEWLSEVVLALAHDSAAWTGVAAVTAIAFAATIALMTRALLRTLEPIYALLFAALAVAMTGGHLLARPHILAMPLMMLWTIGLVQASESRRAPTLWLLPTMTLWANMHGGFTLGLALAFAFALEAVWNARQEQRVRSAIKRWSIFLIFAVACSLLTPHGTEGIRYTWQIFFESSYALGRIGEWQSPSFQKIQPLEIWLMTGLAMILYQGIRLPPFRLLLLLGLLHLALKHARNIELLGLLVPLILATPLATQWRRTPSTTRQLDQVDRLFKELARPAGIGAVTLTLAALLSLTLGLTRVLPILPPESAAPDRAIRTAQDARIKGPVLNDYGWGGYLVYLGIPPFIDGRADMYRDAFLREYIEALALKETDGLIKLLQKYEIEWTLLPPGSPAVTMLDFRPEWRRLYADKTAVVHIRDVNQGSIAENTTTSVLGRK